MSSPTPILALAMAALLCSACEAEVVEPSQQPSPPAEDDGCEGIHTCSGFMVSLQHEDFNGWEELLPEMAATFPDVECTRDRIGDHDVVCYPPAASCGFDEEDEAQSLEQRFIDTYGNKATTFVESCVCRGYC